MLYVIISIYLHNIISSTTTYIHLNISKYIDDQHIRTLNWFCAYKTLNDVRHHHHEVYHIASLCLRWHWKHHQLRRPCRRFGPGQSITGTEWRAGGVPGPRSNQKHLDEFHHDLTATSLGIMASKGKSFPNGLNWNSWNTLIYPESIISYRHLPGSTSFLPGQALAKKLSGDPRILETARWR